MEFKDYYATLGLTKSATDVEIKRAYRKLARQHHPDLNPGDKAAETRFKEINEANEVLGDPEKRRKYDELGANWRAYEQAPAGAGAASQYGPFQQAGGTRYRTMTPEEMEDLFGGQDPFSDFFHTFFGGAGPGSASGRAGGARRGGGRTATRSRRGQDLEQAVDLTLEEVNGGTSRRLRIQQDGRDRTVEVRIPAGVKDGARVRAAGEGGPAAEGGQAGDLYLTVRVLPHSQFERRGQDLYRRVEMPLLTAILGGEITVPTLGGSPVRLRVPELTGQGRVFRLRGHGLPAVGKPDERGDLYVTADLRIPAKLTDEERTHYEALKAIQDRGA
jgi:DnaJ-class molecular chaperone